MPANSQQLEIFSGWKQIADYLGKGVRTAQRYERALSLPVHRPAGTSKGSVIATKAELDGWINASPIREAFRQPHSILENASMLQEFHQRIVELHRLREEAAQLRQDLRVSLAELRAGIQILSEQELVPFYTERRLVADVLRFDLSTRKVH